LESCYQRCWWSGDKGIKVVPVVGINPLNKFLKLQSPRLRRIANPSELYEWMRELAKIFKIMMCPEEYKVGLAMHLFTGEADHWWDCVESSEEEEQTNPLRKSLKRK